MSGATAISEDLSALREARGVLHDAFGVAFDLWEQRGAGWERMGDEASSTGDAFAFQFTASPVADSEAWPDRVDGRRVCCRVVGSQAFVAVPVWEGVVATAWLPRAPRWLLLRLARMARQRLQALRALADLRREQHTFLVQVTRELESVAFLRSALKRLELTEDSLDLEAFARRLMTTMQPLLRCESLVLVVAGSADILDDGGTGTDHPAQAVCFEGAEDVSQRTCLRLVERYRRDCVDQPVVLNGLARYEPEGRYPRVRGFVMAPIARREEAMGWLLALNCARQDHFSPLHASTNNRRAEFSMHEANLLGFAASLLGTHASNIEFVQREALHAGSQSHHHCPSAR